jgi:hypothetical protein
MRVRRPGFAMLEVVSGHAETVGMGIFRVAKSRFPPVISPLPKGDSPLESAMCPIFITLQLVSVN